MDEQEKPLLVHLSELRTSIVRALLGLFAAMCLCYAFVDYIMAALRKPMLEIMSKDAKFVVLSPQEYFFTELKAALFCGFVLAFPWVFWQLWRFVAPGLYKNEKRSLLLFVIGASLFFAGGCFFAYFLVFPAAFSYFLGMLPEGISGSFSIANLYGFTITLLMAFGLIFQTPLVVFMLIMAGIVEAQTLAKYRRHVFVVSFIVGAILTPPDPITQIMLALPCYGLFEIALFCARIATKSEKRTILKHHVH